MVGNPVKFVYVTTGGVVPAEMRDNADTIYFLEETKEIKVGTTVLANVDADAVSTSDLADILEAYTIKSIVISGSGDTVNNVSFDATSGQITMTKGAFPSLAKGADPTPATASLAPGDTFEVEISTSVSGHTITDNKKQYTLPAYTGGQGVTVSGTTISLPQAFSDYLVTHTFATPVISAFTVTGLGSSAEIGTSVSVTGFTHAETNIENISGTLTLKKGSTTLKTGISPSSVSATIALDSAETVTRTTAGTETFTLSGLDTLGGTISKSQSKTFYVPKFLGYNAATSVTANDVLNMSKGQMMPSTITLPSTAYIYFVTDGTISTVKDADTGFGVPLETPVNLSVSINGVPVTYHVYRTSDSILAGTYHFNIS